MSKNNVYIHDNILSFQEGFTVEFINQIMKEKHITGLQVGDVLFEKKIENLNFLKELICLEELRLTQLINDLSFDFLRGLPKLTLFSNYDSGKQIVDLSNLLNLRKLYLLWRNNKTIGIEKCIKLEDLLILKWPYEDLLPLSSLRNLRKISLSEGRLSSLKGINYFQSLDELMLYGLRSFSEFDGLDRITKIRKISIEACSNIFDISILGEIKSLEEIELINCKEIQSIKFLDNLPKVRRLRLVGNTQIVDGDLLPAQKIKKVFCKHFQHYNLRLD